MTTKYIIRFIVNSSIATGLMVANYCGYELLVVEKTRLNATSFFGYIWYYLLLTFVPGSMVWTLFLLVLKKIGLLNGNTMLRVGGLGVICLLLLMLPEHLEKMIHGPEPIDELMTIIRGFFGFLPAVILFAIASQWSLDIGDTAKRGSSAEVILDRDLLTKK